MYVNAELIAIVAATIALGTTMLASIRGVRQEGAIGTTSLAGDIKALESGLRGEMGDLAARLKGEMTVTRGAR